MDTALKIIEHKKREISLRKIEWPFNRLEKERFYTRNPLSLLKFLKNKTRPGIIAEYCRKTLDGKDLNDGFSVEAVTKAYKAYGAAAISIATDQKYSGGSLDDLYGARDNGLPVLRKDFIIDEYQLIESKAFGADAILLMASILTDRKSVV